MFSQPQAEHQWLAKFIGSWTFEASCYMGPDKPADNSSGKVAVRSLGAMWTLFETEGSHEGNPWGSIITLGFDPLVNQYVGTFVGSMMAQQWVYAGTLDAAGRVLTLDTEGLKFDQTGRTKYQDIIESVDDDHWILKSVMLADDGQWLPFMESHHYRVK